MRDAAYWQHTALATDSVKSMREARIVPANIKHDEHKVRTRF